ncbi:unnamed protein product [Paramecium pentaurelia]|uniref:PH domain-containing protein n=1 Tax=Paramecium pentaurelia TaxID=43138 RepID=A0A8S1SVR2_9CILI|nr:unnamed protein product [Paramecium pentaurelia]
MLDNYQCPSKQHYLQKNIQKKYQDDSVNDSNSIKLTPNVRNQMLGVSKISDIKVYNDYSIDSQIFDKSSILEQSLEQELRIWKEQYKVDPQVVQKIELQIRNIDNQITQLATQFEICINLQQKTQSYFQEFQQIVKGTTFTKFSRSNSKKTALRTIFYCPFLNAICWKSKSSKFPSSKQIIPIDQIIQIHTNYQKYKLFKKNFTIPKQFNEEFFFAIEGRNGYRLELIAESKQEQELYIRILNQLVDNNQKSFNSSFFIEQYSQNINQIKKNLDTSKQCFIEAIEKLQYNFIQNTTSLLQHEKEKNILLKKRSCHIMNQNKQQIDELGQQNHQQKKMIQELQLQKEYYEQRIVQLQEFYNVRTMQFKTSQSPQLSQINQILKDIIGLNGENSIYNESLIDIQIQQIDQYQDCLKNLRKVQDILVNQQNLEINLRTKMEKYQNENSNLQQQIKKLQIDINECEGINQMLQKKLIDFNLNMESKEEQFNTVIKEIQSLKQHLPCRMSTSQSQSEYSIKLNEQDQTLLNFYIQIITFLFFILVPEELSNEFEQIMQGFFVKISTKYGDLLQISLLIKQINKVYQNLEQQYKNKIEQLFKEQIYHYFNYIQNSNKKSMPSPTSTQNSNKLLIVDKTFSSPNNKIFVKNSAKFYKRETFQSLDPQQIKYLSQLVK